MSKNDHNPEVEQEEENNVETEVAETTEETTDDSSASEIEALRAEKAAAEAEAAKYRRLLKKSQRPKTATPVSEETTAESAVDTVSRAEVEELLLARDYDAEELEEIKDLARGKGISYAEAIETPLFKTWKATRDAEKKRQDAALGSSKGGAFAKSKEIPQEREAHKEWYQRNFG